MVGLAAVRCLTERPREKQRAFGVCRQRSALSPPRCRAGRSASDNKKHRTADTVVLCITRDGPTTCRARKRPRAIRTGKVPDN